MINTVNIDLTNNSCWGTANAAGSDNEIKLFIKLLDTLLDKTDIHLEFTKPDGVIVITDNLSVENKQVSYEIPFNLYTTTGTLKLRIIATDYISDYINFNILEDYAETDDICVKFDTTNYEFNINKCVPGGADILLQVYPVGAIYMSVNNINPSILFGGIWEAWGKGKVPVGVDTAQTEFNTVEKTGGNKNMQEHYHDVRWSDPNGKGVVISCVGEGLEVLDLPGWTWSKNGQGLKGSGSNLYTSYEGEGDSGNLQPYITCYMWKRTA